MRDNTRKRIAMLAALGAVAASLGSAASASAASIVVNSAADPTVDASHCTLRQAIDSANSDATPSGSNCVAGAGTDTITFAQSILPAHITLTGELAPATNMTIQGQTTDPSQVTVDGDNQYRDFEIIGADPGGGTPGPTVTLSGLTVMKGHYFYPGPMPQGGAGIAVDFNSILTVDHSVVTDNHAAADINGGGSQQNTIGQVWGGGILSNGTLNVTDSTITGNTLNAHAIGGTSVTAAVADGAGIASFPARSLNVNRSTVLGNSATATAPTGIGKATETLGAGIMTFSQGTASVTDSTIVNNTLSAGTADQRTEFGGGFAAASSTTVTSSTVTGNQALEGANLAVDPNDGSMSLTNTIIAEPTTGANCARVTSAGFNWSDDGTCDPNGTTDVANTDPHLLALSNYGGPTLTRPPAAPNGTDPTVIDKGVAASLTADQPGLPRTVGYDIANATGGDGTDVGAVEVRGATPTSSNPASPGDSSSPNILGTSEPNTTVSLFQNGTCASTALGTASNTVFAATGINAPGPFAVNTSTAFTAQAAYGTATSACSSPFNYQRRPALPTLTSTNPASGGDNNNPKVIGTATASSTVNIYKGAGCTGPVAGTGSAATLAGAGIPVSVPDNSTTSFYAKATGVGGTSDCSAPLSYTEVTPPPPAPPAVTPTPTPTPTKKKCKKAKKRVAQSAKKKCKKKKR
jgi:CSLREA domain-containing protein